MRSVEEINYHHLLYFWVVAHEGSITAASRRLHVSQPTVSMQIQKLERSLKAELFRKAGRGLILTERGQEILRHAEPIFAAGRRLVDFLGGDERTELPRLMVGVSDTLPKLVGFRLLEPAFRLVEPVQVVCHEGKLDELLAGLAVHRYDVVLSEAPLSQSTRVRAYNHLLGDCGVTFFATAELTRLHKRQFPASLDGAPMVLPTESTELRRTLEEWFEQARVRPRVVGEFEDSGLLKEVGHAGVGIFPAATAIEPEVRRQYRVQVVGRAPAVRQRFFAISAERRLSHPAVKAILNNARRDLFI